MRTKAVLKRSFNALWLRAIFIFKRRSNNGVVPSRKVHIDFVQLVVVEIVTDARQDKSRNRSRFRISLSWSGVAKHFTR